MTATLQTLLKGTPSFGEVLERLYATAFTGKVTVHFAEGQAKVIELPNPLVIRLDNASRSAHDGR